MKSPNPVEFCASDFGRMWAFSAIRSPGRCPGLARLESHLMDSHTTVAVPFDDHVLYPTDWQGGDG
jgi:hypothetical protein